MVEIKREECVLDKETLKINDIDHAVIITDKTVAEARDRDWYKVGKSLFVKYQDIEFSNPRILKDICGYFSRSGYLNIFFDVTNVSITHFFIRELIGCIKLQFAEEGCVEFRVFANNNYIELKNFVQKGDEEIGWLETDGKVESWTVKKELWD